MHDQKPETGGPRGGQEGWASDADHWWWGKGCEGMVAWGQAEPGQGASVWMGA